MHAVLISHYKINVSRLFIYPSIPTQEESLGQLRGAVVKLYLRLQDGALETEVVSTDLC